MPKMDLKKQMPIGSETELGILKKYGEALGLHQKEMEHWNTVQAFFHHLAKDSFVPSSFVLQRRILESEQVIYRTTPSFPDYAAPGGTQERKEPQDIMPEVVYETRLTNGGRLYLDGAHPECSSPLCANARELVVWEKAMERIAADAARETRRQTSRIFDLYKNNSDGMGSSWGYHFNTSASWDIFSKLVHEELKHNPYVNIYLAFVVSMLPLVGAGKVGRENVRSVGEDELYNQHGNSAIPYQISQRADFMRTIRDRDTMSYGRALINTRGSNGDRTYSVNPQEYLRFHNICFDSNMSEVPTFLKAGIMSIVMRMLENHFLHPALAKLVIENPVRAFKKVSHDLTVKEKVIKTSDGAHSAFALNRICFIVASEFLSVCGGTDTDAHVIELWRKVLDCFEREDNETLSTMLDWKAKQMLIERTMARKGFSWDDEKAKLMDIQYHNINTSKSLYYALEKRGLVQRITTDQEIAYAMHNPPKSTSAYLSGLAVKEYKDLLADVNWHYLDVIGIGKILMHPFQYTKRTSTGILKLMEQEHNSRAPAK